MYLHVHINTHIPPDTSQGGGIATVSTQAYESTLDLKGGISDCNCVISTPYYRVRISEGSDLNTGFCLNVFPPLYLAFCSSVGNLVNKAWPSLRWRDRWCGRNVRSRKQASPPALGENVQARPSIMIGPGGQPDQALSWLDEKLWDRTKSQIHNAPWVL